MPSTRWNGLNLVLFTGRLAPTQIELVEQPEEPVGWDAWRKRARR